MTAPSDVPAPPPGACVASVAGRTLWLLPERAAFDPAARALIVADPHVGKAAAFRGAGVPVPRGTTAADLARLDAALGATGAERLWILGDLLHARTGRAQDTMAAVGAWRARHPALDVLLVRGNHDVAAGDPPPEWRMATVAEPHRVDGWELRHAPPAVGTGGGAGAGESGGGPAEGSDGSPAPGARHVAGGPSVPAAPLVLAGHLHPSVRLAGVGDRMSAPCFHLRDGVLVLPAFGSFTGTHRVRPGAGDRIWAVGPGEVAEVRVRQR